MSNMVDLAGHTYRIGKLNARQQLHVARRLSGTPISALIGASTGGSGVSDAVRERALQSGINLEEMQDMLPRLLPSLSLRSLSMLSQADCDFVVDTCLSVCARREGNAGAQGWMPVWNAGAGQMQFQDLDLSVMLDLTVEVLKENLGNFFGDSLAVSPSLPTTAPQ